MKILILSAVFVLFISILDADMVVIVKSSQDNNTPINTAEFIIRNWDRYKNYKPIDYFSAIKTITRNKNMKPKERSL